MVHRHLAGDAPAQIRPERTVHPVDAAERGIPEIWLVSDRILHRLKCGVRRRRLAVLRVVGLTILPQMAVPEFMERLRVDRVGEGQVEMKTTLKIPAY